MKTTNLLLARRKKNFIMVALKMLKKIMLSTRVELMTSALLVRRSTN